MHIEMENENRSIQICYKLQIVFGDEWDADDDDGDEEVEELEYDIQSQHPSNERCATNDERIFNRCYKWFP